jgi:hypothetical protein
VQPGDGVTLSWSPNATFVVDPEEGKRNDGPTLQ